MNAETGPERCWKALLLNDIHIGAVRSAGTTLNTRTIIQESLQIAFSDILQTYQDRDLLINGDLFDGFEVDTGQMLQTYLTLHDWLLRNPSRVAHLAMGNHDIAKNSQRTSSFALLGKLLQTAFPDRVRVYDKGLEMVHWSVWVIPHCVNQDLFELELTKALEVAPGYLLLHANYDNKFAVEADHSLNVSEEMARKLIKHGWTLVFAHEHQKRNALAGQVIITGNQWPTSVSDCLTHGDGQKDGKKFAHLIDTEKDFMSEVVTVTVKPIQTWQAEGDFIQMDWKELEACEHRFIRVTGEADAGQSADVVNTIARYRQHSKALVITNAVKIAGIAGVDDMAALSVEKLQAVNVEEALCAELTKEEAAKVKELLHGPDQNPAEETAPSDPEAVA